MATGIAHELNQPLSVLKTSSGFMQKKIRKKESIREDILQTLSEQIEIHVDRATKIINHLRQFGRKSDPDLQSVEIYSILHRAFEFFSQQLKVRGISVKWEVDENLPRILCHPNRLEQVFINLLINARDAIEEKWGSEGVKEGMREIRIASVVTSETVAVEISDTGAGIPPNIADKIFEPFFTTKEVGKGTGLGLSISYSIIKECGGKIEIVSRAPEGARFRVEFPIVKNH